MYTPYIPYTLALYAPHPSHTPHEYTCSTHTPCTHSGPRLGKQCIGNRLPSMYTCRLSRLLGSHPGPRTHSRLARPLSVGTSRPHASSLSLHPILAGSLQGRGGPLGRAPPNPMVSAAALAPLASSRRVAQASAFPRPPGAQAGSEGDRVGTAGRLPAGDWRRAEPRDQPPPPPTHTPPET